MANQFAAVETDLGHFASLIKDSADLKRLVPSPVFSAEEQARAIAAILDQAGIGGLVANLIKVAAAQPAALRRSRDHRRLPARCSPSIAARSPPR